MSYWYLLTKSYVLELKYVISSNDGDGLSFLEFVGSGKYIK